MKLKFGKLEFDRKRDHVLEYTDNVGEVTANVVRGSDLIEEIQYVIKTGDVKLDDITIYEVNPTALVLSADKKGNVTGELFNP